MKNKILLTSFTTWLPEHKSNSADDLLHQISQLKPTSSLTFLRNLPVDIEQASYAVTRKIDEIAPDMIICCGMAEKRAKLSLESNATYLDSKLETSVNLEQLIIGLDAIEISHDAGKFVCEGVYYSVLKHIRDRQIHSQCIFVHVPLLIPNNSTEIIQNFQLILQKMTG